MTDHGSRRSFFSRLSAGMAAFGLGTGAAQAQTPSPARFQPVRHPEDDWYDTLPGKHRTFLDAVTPNGAGEAIAFATNIFTGNKNGYRLDDADVALVICLRHHATPFAYNDAIWSKYGAVMAGFLKFDDPKTQKAPIVNVYNTSGYGEALPNRNIAFDALAKRGVHFAVCGLATRFQASIISKAHGMSVDDALKELGANLLPNGHIVPAGVVAVNRAQEHGYSFMYVG
jgi:intracellular sulfur oxidation DsrE/DsrF family protein